MLDPGVCAVRRVLAELNPFLTQEAEDTIRLYLADKLVRAESGGPLFSVATTGFMLRGEIGGREVVVGG